ncbi:DUF624 domain-containing protein [Propioniciclava coleopterorum]|uniref:DUF624 domain-containing protein n=1 Tax=Propioniciclava coleopterorum TaxID=2714937 RepID=A0A6G7Y2L5_9ACTN|nr:DUF624 domain-containing protein [Propioniciclava coleopterorum]QIK71052.1 DUF624 domain-containing protein [Propioniciclava coleopterorum]
MTRTTTPISRSGTWAERAYEAGNAVLLALQLQGLMVLGTLAGGVLFGLAPSLTAAAALARADRRGDLVRPWRDFWPTWRADLVPATRAAAPLAGLALIAAANLTFAAPLGLGWAIASIAAALAIATAVAWFPALYAHYAMPWPRYTLLALALVARKPLASIILLFLSAGLAFLATWSPAIAVFVAAGAWVLVGSRVALSAFDENEERLADGPEVPDLVATLPSRPLDLS